MRLRGVIAGTVAIATTMFAASADAKVMVATYTGTISFFLDQLGDFGSPDQDLVGQAYKSTYTFDTSLGSDDESTADLNLITGGTFGTRSSPITSATLSIGAVTLNIPWQSWSYAYAGNYNQDTGSDQIPVGFHEEYTNYFNTEDGSYTSFVNVLYTDPVVPDLGAPFYSTPSGLLARWSGGDYQRYDPATGQTSVSFSANSVTISAVPELSSWTMMLLGIGGMGAVLRARRDTKQSSGLASA